MTNSFISCNPILFLYVCLCILYIIYERKNKRKNRERKLSVCDTHFLPTVPYMSKIVPFGWTVGEDTRDLPQNVGSSWPQLTSDKLLAFPASASKSKRETATPLSQSLVRIQRSYGCESDSPLLLRFPGPQLILSEVQSFLH